MYHFFLYSILFFMYTHTHVYATIGSLDELAKILYQEKINPTETQSIIGYIQANPTCINKTITNPTTKKPETVTAQLITRTRKVLNLFYSDENAYSHQSELSNDITILACVITLQDDDAKLALFGVLSLLEIMQLVQFINHPLQNSKYLLWKLLKTLLLNLASKKIAAHDGINTRNDAKSTMAKEYPTPLFIALGLRNEKIIEELLHAGANANDQKFGGLTALSYAVRIDSTNIIRILLKAGANPNIKDVFNNTSLLYAVALETFEPSCKPRLEVVRMLLDAGADINAAGMALTQRPPLFFALPKSNKPKPEDLVILQELLDRKANIHVTTSGGIPLFNDVVQRGSLEVVRMFLAAGANVNAQATSGAAEHTPTALHTAAERGLPDIAEELLDAGADSSIKNNLGQTPVQYAQWIIDNKFYSMYGHSTRDSYDAFIKVLTGYHKKSPAQLAIKSLITTLTLLQKKLLELRNKLQKTKP